MKISSSSIFLGILFIIAPERLFAAEQENNNHKSDNLSPIVLSDTSPEKITVYGHNNNHKNIVGSTTVSSKAIYDFNLNTLDEAANIIPGVNVAYTGNARNERMIYVRGFNRFQVPLLLDGVRVYLPADNRLDYGRFLTPDIAEIQIDKGYASVLDGPDGMGGLINLVTRKPTKKVDAEIRATSNLDHDGGYGGYNVYGFAGTRQEKWYTQFSFSEYNVDHIDLSSHFKPTASQGKGKRLFSDSLDWRINTKIGITPNETDEYVLSFTRQEGEKRAPLSTIDPPAYQKDWTWPNWDIDSLTLMTNTALTDKLFLRSRLYRNTFYNMLRSFDNIHENSQSIKKAFNSYYNDTAYGGNIRLDYDISKRDTLGFAFYGRLDEHRQHNHVFPAAIDEPTQKSKEESYSAALENILHINNDLELTTAISYDWRFLNRAEGFSNGMIYYPIKNNSSWNGQARLVWKVDKQTKTYVSFSDRSRFPTLFERFSTRFGGAISNPGLKPERSQNYEIGASHDFGKINVSGAFFFSHVTDAIVSFPMIYDGLSVTQSRNLGHGNYTGFELSAEANIISTFLIGGNYTYIHRTLSDPSNDSFRPTDVPTHKAFIYAEWKPIKKLRIMPSLDIAANRWTTDSTGIRYFRTGHYVNLATHIDYQLTNQLQFGLGAKNLLDQNYQLTAGYPEAGRSFFFTLKATY